MAEHVPPMPTISFVVPAYNVAAYLEECLESIVRACAPGDGIILVDDGSRDDTNTICHRWARAHPKLITLIAQRNQGLSAARNHGLKRATGEYVLFMDSDDVVNAPAIAQARQALGAHAPDVLVMDFSWWTPELNHQRRRSPRCSHPARQLITDRESFCTDTFRDAMLSACSRFFKRGLLSQLGEDVFPVGKAYEEIASVPRLTLRARSLYYLDEVLFDYRIRTGSITQSKTPKHCLELAQASATAIHELRGLGLSRTVETAANMAAAIVLVRAMRDCGSVPGGPYSLYQRVWQTRQDTLSIDMNNITQALDQSGWHDARKSAKHLRFASQWPITYILSRQLIYGWKRCRQADSPSH